MGAVAIMETHNPRRRRRGLVASLLALVRGPAFLGLALPGLLLLLIPVLALVLAVLGLFALTHVWGRQNQTFLGLALWAGDLLVVRYGVAASLNGMRGLARVTRRLSDRWMGLPIVEPYEMAPHPHLRMWSGERFRWMASDPATWRDLLWTAANASFGWVLPMVPMVLAAVGMVGCIGVALFGPYHHILTEQVPLVVLGAVLMGSALWTAPYLLQAYGGLARSLLGPSGDPELARRVRHLAQTRSETIDASASEIRRIERDLHDGAQARLVAMGMTLSVAEELLDTDPEATRKLLAEARQASSKALAELRALVSGIHPPILADRGLVDAIRALALDSAVRVGVVADPVGRPPAPVESAAYFAVSELLANVSKHANARQALVDVRYRNGTLAISVTDDGQGGADPERGTGLRGIERRLAAFDGVLGFSSPPGGPTIVQLEIPCELSSPKTFSS
jgi:signal transduction histidine kinase